MTIPHLLHRTTFETSRTLEFFTERELTMQLGFPREQWSIALLKELIDNALDACETVGIAPEITVSETRGTLSVQDNGPGLPFDTLKRSLDYLVRVSDKAYYVSPSRGQLGNALKCLWATPYVLSGGRSGRIDVETAGRRYEVCVQLDQIAQEPKLTLTAYDAIIKTGTRITIHFPDIACYPSERWEGNFYNSTRGAIVEPVPLLCEYAILNPHGTFHYHGDGEDGITLTASDPTWRKWLPSSPTSPHWYTPARFQALLLAYLSTDRRTDRVRTIREIVAEFDGLSGVKAGHEVCATAGLHRATLEDLVSGETLDTELVTRLLDAMQARARQVKPEKLGTIGEAHFLHALTTAYSVDPNSFSYRRAKGTADGLPYVLEVACGWHGEQESGHRLYGYNCAPSLAIPFRDLHSALHEARIGTEDVLTLVVHLLCPRLDATDRGKTAVTLPSAIREDLIKAVRLTCQEWTKVKREDDLRARRGAAIREKLERQQRREQFTVKEAAWVVMEQAYMKASDNGRLPANARQIMYVARPEIIDLTGKAQPWTNSAYFTQTLLPDFMDAHAELTAGWDVVFDARGHFAEPHTGEQFGIGTLEVRKYIRNWQRNISMPCWTYTLKHEFDTAGPYHRYAYVLFVEKEGFNPLIERAQISQRYDMPVMSTKGMTVTAARQLIEALSQAGVTILVAHDFDKSGIEILDKFQSDTRRYRYSARPRIVDLGLRLDAARAMSLESEQVQYNSGVDPRANLRHCGATVEECAFLVHGRNRESGKWYGERIELNAMTSQQFLTWLEEGLVAAGVAKVVPDEEALLIAYKHQKRIAALQAALDKAQCELSVQEETIDLPANLAARIREKIANTTIPWDDGLWQVIWEEANDE